MIDDMSDNGKIDKYYSYNVYSLDVLRNNQLFFSHPSNFNDPFDSSFNLLVKPYKKFCDALHGIKNMSNAFEKQGIGCFTKANKPDNKHFWSLYAGNYSGFALEFDEDELNNLYPPLHLSRVNYFNEPMNLDNFETTFGFDYIDETYTVRKCIDTYPYDLMPLDRLFQYLFLYKDKSIWQNEVEYRMVIGEIVREHYQDRIIPNSHGYLLNLPQGAIKSITFGYKISDTHKSEILEILKGKEIPVYIATPDIITTTTFHWGITIKSI